ncbi:hypothetical protein AQUCO_00300451v1 [Aquilegia coerulea]|uniref:WRC domain-containing protein n=1 Tax=Aquilegia coerulea TaxID=218851 RepID=A0A2G5EYY7_AQUCA|nr:hypothetical protein AQUCO_00300451v1 [Aquilegia coerulea]
MEFEQYELRIHLDWVDGKWVCSSVSQDQDEGGYNQIDASSNIEEDQCDFSRALVQHAQKDQRPCGRRGPGWRCPEIALSDKRYCQQHQLQLVTRNIYRRKRPREKSLEEVAPIHLISELHQPLSTSLEKFGSLLVIDDEGPDHEASSEEWAVAHKGDTQC